MIFTFIRSETCMWKSLEAVAATRLKVDRDGSTIDQGFIDLSAAQHSMKSSRLPCLSDL